MILHAHLRRYGSAPALVYLVLGAGASPAPPVPAAGDQVYTGGIGTTEVSFSLIEGGATDGTIDAGGLVDGDPAWVDLDGQDNIRGTLDDGVMPGAGSAAIDAGSNALLPADRFDVDGDGDTGEPFPTDITGGVRVRDGGTPSVDAGAFESEGQATGVENDEVNPGLEFELPHPNPLRGTGEIRFRIPVTERVEIAIYDVLGRRQAVLFDDVVRANEPVRVPVAAGSLPSGVYFAHLRSPSFRRSEDFVVVR